VLTGGGGGARGWGRGPKKKAVTSLDKSFRGSMQKIRRRERLWTSLFLKWAKWKTTSAKPEVTA